jgi:hypothetical protein
MKVVLESPVRNLSGTFDGSALVYYTRDGRTYGRKQFDVKDVESTDQIRIRSYATLASQNWDMLTDAQRAR